MLSLSEILQSEEGNRLEKALFSKADSPVLQNLSKPQDALKYMRASLRGSYLFGRHVVPTYISHAFATLVNYPPANDVVGTILSKFMGMCDGELSTNNIFNREGECHSHFNDLFEAYAEAGGDTQEFLKFSSFDGDTLAAIDLNHGLWSKAAAGFARKLLGCCDDPLASFILMPCNEMLSTIINPVALSSLCDEPQFAKFRRFLEVHVQLDRDDHGCVALEWLQLHLEKSKTTPNEIAEATRKVLTLYEKA